MKLSQNLIILIGFLGIALIYFGSSSLTISGEGNFPAFTYEKVQDVETSKGFSIGSYSFSINDPKYVCGITDQDFEGKIFDSKQNPQCFTNSFNWRSRTYEASKDWIKLTETISVRFKSLDALYVVGEGFPNVKISYEFKLAPDAINTRLVEFEPFACKDGRLLVKFDIENKLAPGLTHDEFRINIATVGGLARTTYNIHTFETGLPNLGVNRVQLYINDTQNLGVHNTELIPAFTFIDSVFREENPPKVAYQVLLKPECDEVRAKLGLRSAEGVSQADNPIVSFFKKLWNLLFGWL